MTEVLAEVLSNDAKRERKLAILFRLHVRASQPVFTQRIDWIEQYNRTSLTEKLNELHTKL